MEGVTINKLDFYKSEKGYQAITSWYDSLVNKFDFSYESITVDTRFGQTHMLVSGEPDAPPLILVQGVAGSAPLWRYQLRDFAPHFRVYALDTVGQPGRSDANPPSFLDDSYSHWLLDVLDALELENAHFGGISAGGWLVLRLGIFTPERVRKVVMIAPTGLVRARLPVKVLLKNVLPKKEVNQLETDLSSRSYLPPSPNQEFDRQVARAMALATRHYRVDWSLGIYDEQKGSVNRWQGLKVLRQLFGQAPDKLLRQFNVPGLLLMGEFETLYNVKKAAARTKKLMPSTQVEILPRMGHTAVYDAPEVVNPIIVRFLSA